MKYIKIFLIIIIPFILTACFIPERRLYFSWNRPHDVKDACDYEFNVNTNVLLIKTERGYLLDTDKEIYYRLGEEKPYNIDDYYYVMNEVMTFMSNNRNCILIVEGHADIIGHSNGDINYRLSERRASVIRDVILSSGFFYKRVQIFPYSDIIPKYITNTSQNRRVDFVVLKCERELSNYLNYYSNYYSNITAFRSNITE
ncbi:OmpA family protein [Brachyspira sp. G79]|uniref:OmpA family protein n=1 Tax=Brachyspira sp. G79 TaxID=1358104 RepID=UPI000BBCF770|nr:OmpA family protein [Brachyspira sp. G79]PCG19379.1 flagellar motor protein MotB [Brachyspira sp. G79]